MIAWLLSEAGGWIAGALAALLGLWGLYRRGRKDQKRQTALEAAEADARTRQRMDDADAYLGDDPAVLRDLMRSRDPSSR